MPAAKARLASALSKTGAVKTDGGTAPPKAPDAADKDKQAPRK